MCCPLQKKHIDFLRDHLLLGSVSFQLKLQHESLQKLSHGPGRGEVGVLRSAPQNPQQNRHQPRVIHLTGLFQEAPPVGTMEGLGQPACSLPTGTSSNVPCVFSADEPTGGPAPPPPHSGLNRKTRGNEQTSPLRAGADLRPWGLLGDVYPDLKREGQCLARGRQKRVIDEKNARQWERKPFSGST